MDINHCRIFLKVVECGSISSAALETGYTQSAVSYIVKNLEQEMGVKLVNRERSGITLTKNGTVLLPRFKAIVNAGTLLDNSLFDLTNLLSGEVVLGGSYSSKIIFFLPVIEKFHAVYPRVAFKFLDGSSQTIERYITEGIADLGIYTYQKNTKLHYTFIKDDPLLVVLPPDCTDYPEGVFPINDISRHDFITTSFNDEYNILKELNNNQIICNTPIMMDDTFTAVSAVEKHLGITILSELSMKTKSQYNVRCIGLDPPRHRRLCLFVRDLEALTPAARKFYDFCVAEFPALAQKL